MYTGDRKGIIDEDVGDDGLKELNMPWGVVIGWR